MSKQAKKSRRNRINPRCRTCGVRAYGDGTDYRCPKCGGKFVLASIIAATPADSARDRAKQVADLRRSLGDHEPD